VLAAALAFSVTASEAEATSSLSSAVNSPTAFRTLRYLKKYSIGGVGMKAVVHDWTSLDGTSASTSATPNTTSTETVSDKVLK
jgi:hypothetical protein